MGKVIKGLTIYAILISIALTFVSVLALGIMFLSSFVGSPVTLFGYKAMYLSNVVRGDVSVSTLDLDDETIVNVNIDVKDYKVTINQFTDNTKAIGVKKVDSVIGIYKQEFVKNATIVKERVGGTNEYNVNIEVVQPEGFMLYNGSAIVVSLPSAGDLIYNINVKTTSGKVVISGANDVQTGETDENIVVSSLNVSTHSGDLYVEKIAREAELSQVYEDNSIVLDSLTLNTKTGNFDFTNVDKVYIYEPTDQNSINITSDSGRFEFNDVEGAMSFVGDKITLIADTINTNGNNFNYNSTSGYFSIKTLTNGGSATNSITTIRADIDIETLIGATDIETKNGNIKLGEAQSTVNLETTSGNITVTKALDHITTINDKGNTFIDEYFSSANFISKSGDVEAHYTLEESVDKTRETSVNVRTSYVKITNIINKISVEASDDGNINLYFQALTDEAITHEIDIEKGKAKLNFDNSDINAFNLVVSEGKVNGTYGSESISTLLQDTAPNDIIQVLGASSCTIQLNAGSGTITFVTYTS